MKLCFQVESKSDGIDNLDTHSNWLSGMFSVPYIWFMYKSLSSLIWLVSLALWAFFICPLPRSKILLKRVLSLRKYIAKSGSLHYFPITIPIISHSYLQGVDFIRIGRCEAVHDEVRENCLSGTIIFQNGVIVLQLGCVILISCDDFIPQKWTCIALKR